MSAWNLDVNNYSSLVQKQQGVIVTEVVAASSHAAVRSSALRSTARYEIGGHGAFRLHPYQLVFQYGPNNQHIEFGLQKHLTRGSDQMDPQDTDVPLVFAHLGGLPHDVQTSFFGIIMDSFVPGTTRTRKLSCGTEGVFPVRLNTRHAWQFLDLLVARRPDVLPATSLVGMATSHASRCLEHEIIPVRLLSKDAISYSKDITTALDKAVSDVARLLAVQQQAVDQMQQAAAAAGAAGSGSSIPRRQSVREVLGTFLGKYAAPRNITFHSLDLANRVWSQQAPAAGQAPLQFTFKDFTIAVMQDAFLITRDHMNQAVIGDNSRQFFIHLHELIWWATETIVEAQALGLVEDGDTSAAFIRGDLVRFAIEYSVLFTSNAHRQFSQMVVGIAHNDGKSTNHCMLWCPGGSLSLAC